MDYFSCYAATSLTNTSTFFPRRENSPRLKDCPIFNVIKLTGSNQVFLNLKKNKSYLFLKLALRKYTGSAFT